MRISPTALDGVLLIEPEVFGDERGRFHDCFRAAEFAAAGLPTAFAQASQSRSRQGVLRGLHLQLPVRQGKLVEVVAGRVFDVVVDPLRGRWASFELDADHPRMLWIPEGFAHGFLAREDATLLYHLTAPYDPQGQVTIRWDDPDLAVGWPSATPVLSAKDAAGLGLAEFRRRYGRSVSA